MTEYRVGQEVEVTYRARVAVGRCRLVVPAPEFAIRLEALALPSSLAGSSPKRSGFSIKVICRAHAHRRAGDVRMLMARGNQANMGDPPHRRLTSST